MSCHNVRFGQKTTEAIQYKGDEVKHDASWEYDSASLDLKCLFLFLL